MKMLVHVGMFAFSALGGTVAEAAPSDADGAKLIAKYNCVACHTVDKKLVGPAFRDVAKKYASDATAGDKLQSKVKNGSTGVWGAIPMPPNSVSDADLKALVEWILSLK
jgi:cytochrome c